MNTYVIMLKVEVPEGVGNEDLEKRLLGANVSTYGDGIHVAQVVKVVDVCCVNPCKNTIVVTP